MIVKIEYFYGHKVSDCGIENGRVDYATLAKCGDIVLCNDIEKLFYGTLNNEYVEPELVNGYEKYDEEIFQYFIISDNLAELLIDLTEEIVYYIESLESSSFLIYLLS